MSKSKRNRRRGAAAVEFAVVAPLFILLLFAIIEFGRAMMVQQMLTNATREGARQAALPDATAAAVKTAVVDFLNDSSIVVPEGHVTITPDPATAFNNEQITVSVFVPYNQVSWIPGSFMSGNLQATTKMRSERLE